MPGDFWAFNYYQFVHFYPGKEPFDYEDFLTGLDAMQIMKQAEVRL